MRTTTEPNWRFTFSISDVGRLLGKSPVTVRGWEYKGQLTIPRDTAGARKVDSQGIREIAAIAYERKRISQQRLNMINAVMILIEWVENENNRKIKR